MVERVSKTPQQVLDILCDRFPENKTIINLRIIQALSDLQKSEDEEKRQQAEDKLLRKNEWLEDCPIEGSTLNFFALINQLLTGAMEHVPMNNRDARGVRHKD
jgi:hypothetical protein